jgi:hypothetical protein
MVKRAFLAGRSITMRPTEAFFSFFFRYVLSSLRSAWQQSYHCLHTNAKPSYGYRQTETGWMNFLSHRDSLVTDSHVNVTGLFRDTIATTFCTRGEALQDRPFST